MAEHSIKFHFAGGYGHSGMSTGLFGVNGGQLLIAAKQMMDHPPMWADNDPTITENATITVTFDGDRTSPKIESHGVDSFQVYMAGYFLRLKGEAMIIAAIYESEQSMADAYEKHMKQRILVAH